MTTATYKVEVSFDNYVAGLFTIGTSKIYDPADPLNTDDVLAADFGSTTYDDITSYVKSVEIHRGRSGDFAAMDAGTCRLTLHDSAGLFNPGNKGTLTNVMLNPSFEIDSSLDGVADNWTAYESNAELAPFTTWSLSSTQAAAGTYSQKLVMAAATVTAQRYITLYGNNIPARPGEVWSASAQLFIESRTGTLPVTVYIQARDSALAYLENSTAGTFATTTGEWLSAKVDGYTLPANTAYIRVEYRIAEIDSTDAITCYFDAVKLLREAEAGTYYDGNSEGCYWQHDANASYTYLGGGTLANKLKPLRPIRIRGSYSTPDVIYTLNQGLFQGYITKISHNPAMDSKETVIEAVDMFELLSRARVTVSTMTNATVGDIIDQIVENCQIGIAQRNIDVTDGHTVPSYAHAATDSSNMLSEIQDLLTVDRGVFFVNGDGKATYKPHTDWYTTAAATVTLNGTVASGMASEMTIDGVINRQTVTRTSGAAQTYTDNDSVDAHGYCDGSPISSAYIVDDTQSLNLATFIVGICAWPRLPAKKVALINSSPNNIVRMFESELGDIVTVSETGSNTSITGPIEAIDHEITDAGNVHRTTFTVRARPEIVPYY